MVHSFDFDKFKEIVSNKGLKTTSQIKEEARNSIDNFFFRRYGLVASVIIMTMLAFALYLYIQQIEKRQKTN
jgi:replication initiation and membrane attachment protein DnaB